MDQGSSQCSSSSEACVTEGLSALLRLLCFAAAVAAALFACNAQLGFLIGDEGQNEGFAQMIHGKFFILTVREQPILHTFQMVPF